MIYISPFYEVAYQDTMHLHLLWPLSKFLEPIVTHQSKSRPTPVVTKPCLKSGVLANLK